MAVNMESFPDVGRLTIAAEVPKGEELRLIKYLGYGWSSVRSRPALVDQVAGARAAAELVGWDGLLKEQREFLEAFWEGADVEVDGDVQIQQAVRFGLFHILQAGARAEQRPIPAKGLTGTGYDGHTFWDTEAFVLPVLTHTHPSAAADALRWRALTLDTARAHAADLGLEGAAFAWRTSHGGGGSRHARRGVRGAGPPSGPSSRPPACGARSASMTPRASSALRASPARTSTAR